MSSDIDTLINKLEEYYTELDKIIQVTEDIQYTNKKVQGILSEIESIKSRLANLNSDDIRLIAHKKYPGLQAKQFNIAELTAQYEGVYDMHEIATKLYKQYGSVVDGEGKVMESSATDKAIADSVWKLTPVQKLLRNFMATDTPYRGVLIVHGTGVGKTCAGVSIAEDLKHFVKQNETKIFVIRDAEFKRQMFDINKVAKGKPGFQCTGETYLDAIRKSNPRAKEFVLGCVQGHSDDCKRVERLVTKEIEKYYDFSSVNIWAKKVDKLLTSKTKYLSGAEKQKKQVDIIRNIFNNSVLIIDEAHNLRNIGSGGGNTGEGAHNDSDSEREFKLNITILTKVLLYSQNMRLILLSATPMYDKPTDILPLLNFLLLNDKRPEAIERVLFDTDNNIKDKNGFLKTIQGYISYVRGNDPMDFPIRLDASVNMDDEDIVDLKHYPKRDIYGNALDTKVKHLTLVNCPMSREHQAVLLKQINAKADVKDNVADKDKVNNDKKSAKADVNTKENEITKEIIIATQDMNINIDKDDETPALDDENRGFSVAYGMEIGITSFIYRTLEEANGVADTCYGNKGLQAVAKKLPKQITYVFKDDDYALRFKGDNLKEYGPKMWSCLQNILKSTGPVFVYMTFKASGIIPMAFALEMAGFTRYGGEKELLSSKHKDTPNRGEYIIYTGDPALSKRAESFFNLRERMIDETGVKVVLASEVGAEGLNLFGFREIHILDPWHNMNRIEQTIGRVIRYKSHAHLKNPALRNVTVYLYATTLTGNFKDRESIDLHVYSIAESKAIKSGEVEYLLKSAAIDCAITKPLNYRPKELYDKPVMLITSTGKITPYNLYDEPYSKNTLYMADSDYTCVNPVTKPELPALKFGDVKKYEIELREIIGSVIAILRENMNILESDMLKLIEDTFQNTNKKSSIITPELIIELYKYLIDYFETADIVLLDKYGRRARVSIVPLNIKSGKLDKAKLHNSNVAHNTETHDSQVSVLRLIPLSYFDTQQPVAMQELRFLSALDFGKKHQKFESMDQRQLVKGVSLQQYASTLRKDKQRLLNKEELDYDGIITRITKIIYYLTVKPLDTPLEEQTMITTYYDTNIKVTFTHGILELYKAIFDKLLFVEKLYVLQNLVYKVKHGELLDSTETNLFSSIRYLLVHESEVFKTHDHALTDAEIYSTDFRVHPDKLYGFIIAEFQKLILYRYQDTDSADIKEYFVEDKAKSTTIINRRRTLMTRQQNNQLFGFMIYTKNTTLPPIFKITDYLTRGKKKSVKGASCSSKQVNELISYMKILDPTKSIINYRLAKNRHTACGDLELLFRMKNTMSNQGKYYDYGYTHYLFGPEEYYIWSMDNV